MTDKITIERETLEKAAAALAYCYTAIENMSDDEDDMISRSNSALRAALAAQPVEPVAWTDKATELATDFGVESLRVGSSERKDIIFDQGVASWETVALREKREAARERLRQHIYAAPAAVPLTDKQISEIWESHIVPAFGKNGINPIVFARAVLAAAGDKP